MKNFNEETKLNTSTKNLIIVYVAIAIFEIFFAIIEKEPCWLVVGMLWITIAFIKYCDEKIIKMKDYEIGLLKENIKELTYLTNETKNYNHIPRID